MRSMRLPCRAHGAMAVAAMALAKGTKGTKGRSEEVEVVIKEEEVRRHNQVSDAWISFNGAVYDITKYVHRHPPCPGLNWAERVAGRRFEDFLGRDAFGPAHLGCGPDANCSAGMKAGLTKLLEPYKLGRFQAAAPSPAAELWPEEGGLLRLRLEGADGQLLQVFTVDELKKYEKSTRKVTHKCTTSGNLNQQEWTGVWIGELLPKHRVERSYDPLVTFVGMDGFGYSMFLSRALKEDVILAYEQNGEALTTETGGPVRLV
ncbi:unnamed protein product [Cladocopium goreaui]|nr:unnamed protein product [Cladocopium goreaui]